MIKKLQFATVFNPAFRCICDYINIAFGDYFGQKSAGSLVKFFEKVFCVIVDFEELHGAEKTGA